MPATQDQTFVAASTHRRRSGRPSLAPPVSATVPTFSFGTLTTTTAQISTTFQVTSSDAGPLPGLSNTKAT